MIIPFFILHGLSGRREGRESKELKEEEAAVVEHKRSYLPDGRLSG